MTVSTMHSSGMFYGVGVGPGPQKLLPVAAVEAINESDLIILPRGKEAKMSIAGRCVEWLSLPESKTIEIVYNMETDPNSLLGSYSTLAEQIAEHLVAGQSVCYLTLGDSLTYSTYSYLLLALQRRLPGLRHKTIPGITSYAAIASACNFPLGQGKERILILPCPESADTLEKDILDHDIVVLMKIGHRLPVVLKVLSRLQIMQHCAFANNFGLPGETVCERADQLPPGETTGYFSTMLIRKNTPGETE